jgi:hypothetical protein
VTTDDPNVLSWEELTGHSVTEEPTQPGWYIYEGAADLTVFYRSKTGQWWVHSDAGTVHPCVWGYIEQATGVYSLVPITTERRVLRALARDAYVESEDRSKGMIGRAVLRAMATWLTKRAEALP